jgi:tetratricopeptide (TPR) repeat protein
LLKPEEVEIFAPPREMEAAVTSYNRSLVNLRNDSADIAQIALRKLVINYPLFGPASLLYGACLFENHQYDAAAAVIERARIAGLNGPVLALADTLEQELLSLREPVKPESSATPRNAARSFASRMIASREPDDAASNDLSTGRGSMPGAAPIVEKTGRTAKPRMASRREVERVMRGESGEPTETHVVSERLPRENLSLALKIAAIVVAATLLAVGGLWLIPRLAERRQASQQPSPSDRLDYLLAELNARATGEPALAQLLADYMDRFDPPLTEPAVETTPASLPAQETTPTASTPTLEPSPTPVAPDPGAALAKVYQDYQAALLLGASDPVSAAETLATLRQSAAALVPTLTSEAVPMTVQELQTQIQQAYDRYRMNAAEALRLQGRDAYAAQDYRTSLDYYLRSYALNPAGYGGGVAYYCGRNHQALGQYEEARPFYEYVIANYPGKELASFAAIRLREMQPAASQTTVDPTEPPASEPAPGETTPAPAPDETSEESQP